MTAEPTAPIIEGDARDIAENLLHRAATLALVLGKESSEAGVASLITQAMALAGTGYAQLAALDAADESANRSAALAGDVLRPSGEPDLITDNNGDVWVRTPYGDFHCTTSNLDNRTGDEVRETFGPCREYDLRPPRPAG